MKIRSQITLFALWVVAGIQVSSGQDTAVGVTPPAAVSPNAAPEAEPHSQASVDAPDSLPLDASAHRPANDQNSDQPPGVAKSATRDSAAATPREDSRPETINLREVDESVRSRYRNRNGEWWYQLKTGKWMYWRDGRWLDFDPATYSTPDTSHSDYPESNTTARNDVAIPRTYSVVPDVSLRRYIEGPTGYDYSRPGIPQTQTDYPVPYRSYYRGTPQYYGPGSPGYGSPAGIRRFGGIERGAYGFGAGRYGGFGSFGRGYNMNRGTGFDGGSGSAEHTRGR